MRGVEVWHGEGVDDGFFEFFDYGTEAADVFRDVLAGLWGRRAYESTDSVE